MKKQFSNFKSLYMLVHGTQMYICVNVDLNPVIYVQIDFRTSCATEKIWNPVFEIIMQAHSN